LIKYLTERVGRGSVSRLDRGSGEVSIKTPHGYVHDRRVVTGARARAESVPSTR
jgi:hypothetical protein